MNKKRVTTLKVAATYIGTIVGAGFATGQEIFQFFTKFGMMGLAGLIVSTIMFIIFGYIIMDLGKKLKANSHLEIIMFSGGKKLGTIIDVIITIFLFESFTAMIAGTGAMFAQQFNLSSSIGNTLMAILTAVTVLTGINGVINAISFVVPFLLAAVIGTSIFSVFNASSYFTATIYNAKGSSLMNNWFLGAILYASYNIIISVAVLGPLGAEAKDKKTIKNGAILGGLGLGLGSIMIFLALWSNLSEIKNLEVPMIYIASKISYPAQIAYAIVLTAEVYTTAVGSLYGFVSRITETKKHDINNLLIVFITTVAALLASQFGFSNIVTYVYPLIGYGGIILLVSLIVSKFHN
ncbi:MAG: hypothetical protein PHE29_12015 [Tissierellia bacterium]|nr:hypothetical protein [Tissierellia bacterium]MDD4781320.1 hypothetical protein [Tissierellia bacterium]